MAGNELNIFPSTTLQKLHFDVVLNMLLQKCQGNLGREYIEQQNFMTDIDVLENELKCVSELKQIVQHEHALPSSGFNHLTFLNKLTIENYPLSEQEAVYLYDTLQAVGNIRAFFTRQDRDEVYPALFSFSEKIDFDFSVPALIDKVIDIENKIVKESSSPALQQIRKALQHMQQRIQAAFRRALNNYKNKDFLAETEETIRNGRRVLSVLSEHKRSVKGMIVDESGNGNITYIEPDETVALNNELVSLQLDERREIQKILLELTGKLRPHHEAFTVHQTVLAQWDAWQAKAYFALQFNAILPELSKEHIAYLKNFRNPVLEFHLSKSKKQVVPNTLHLDSKNRVLVISGPNAGGKSVILKSVGLIQLMLQFGMLVPVDEGSVMGVFKKIFIDIDDDQSIENDVSTYSSHLQKMRHFVVHADKHTLVLLDEMGVGTDPSLGGAMAEAVLQILNDKKVFGIVTTHFNNLKVFASQTEGMQSAAMAFDQAALRPLYQLLLGQPGSSFTFEIAQKTGMPQQVISLAREKTGENKKALDETLSEMQVEKQFIRGIRKNVQKQEEQLGDLVKNYQYLKKELEKDKKKLQRHYEQKLLEAFNENSRELERLMREWKEERSDKNKFEQARTFIDAKRRELEQKLEDRQNEKTVEVSGVIRVGSKVKMEDGQEIGEVKEIRKDMATIAFGQMLTKVKLGKLVLLRDDEPQKKSYAAPARSSTITEKSVFDYNLDVRGLLKEEAFVALENFLDKAVMYGISKLKIIHGRGTGALRQAVHTYLKKYPYVKTFYAEQEQFGGNGITIVEMK